MTQEEREFQERFDADERRCREEVPDGEGIDGSRRRMYVEGKKADEDGRVLSFAQVDAALIRDGYVVRYEQPACYPWMHGERRPAFLHPCVLFWDWERPTGFRAFYYLKEDEAAVANWLGDGKAVGV